MKFKGQIKEVKSKENIDGKEYTVKITSWEAQAIQLDEYVVVDKVVRITVGEE